MSRFDAIVTGVRAYNVRADLRANEGRLLDYVKNGGTLVVQYNVAEGGNPFGGNTNLLVNIGPYPLDTGRERVTVEQAPVQFPQSRQPAAAPAEPDHRARFRRLDSGARPLLLVEVGQPLHIAVRNARSRPKAADRQHALHTLRQRRLRFHGALLVPRIARRSARRVPHVCQFAERRKDAVSHEPDHVSRLIEDEPPPILGSWRRIYATVIGYLAFLILIFYIFTRVMRS